VKGRPTPIRRDKRGRLVSRCLGLSLWLEGSDLVMADQKSGQRLLTQAEYEQAQRMAAEQQRQAAEERQKAAELEQRRASKEARRERAKRKQTEDQLRAAQAEIAKLRGQLGQSPPDE
jgi:hypothetical protein